MKDQYPYQCFNHFLLRTPTLPYQYISSLLEQQYLSENQIMKCWQDEIIREAVYLASPDLYLQLEKLDGGEVTDADASVKLVQALFKYLLRMSFRPTPFGLFAGVNLGSWDVSTSIEIHPYSKARCHIQLDMQYLCDFARDQLLNSRIRNQVPYYPNPTIYYIGDTIRYIEFRYENKSRTHHVVEINNDPGIKIILTEAVSGKTVSELAQDLVSNDYDENDSIPFINELIENQVLMSGLEPGISSSYFLKEIIGILGMINGTKQKLNSLGRIQGELKQDPGSGNLLNHFSQLTKELDKLGTSYNNKYLFQLDLEKSCKTCNLDKTIITKLQRALWVLKALSPMTENQALQNFNKKFTERFGMREVPLLHALDPELGIPYGMSIHQMDPSPLIDDLRLPLQDSNSEQMSWYPKDDLLLEKYIEALQHDHDKIQITENDLQDLEVTPDDLPPTFNVCFRLLEDDPGNPGIEILWAGGAAATSMIGRFCHINEDIHRHAKDIVAQDATYYPDSILAEIIHLPEERTGNILQRPSLREYEIPYLAKSNLPQSQQIPAKDLFVAVRNEQIILWSKRLGKQVVPRLSSAHNYSRNAIPVYRFLCDLQSQGMHDNLSFSWGSMESKYTFSPRVVFENIVLAPATWRLKRKNFEEVNTWRVKFKMPKMVLLSDFDNELLFNLDNQYSTTLLTGLIKGRQEITIKECLFPSGKAVVHCKTGTYNHEIIASFYKSDLPSDSA